MGGNFEIAGVAGFSGGLTTFSEGISGRKGVVLR